MRMEIEYVQYVFSTPPLTAVSKEEYTLMEADFDNFFDSWKVQVAKERKARGDNPYRFKWKKTFILLGIIGVLLALSFSIDYAGYENVAGFFDIASVIPMLIILFQPFEYFRSSIESGKSAYQFNQKANAYYGFHETLVSESLNYEHYLRLLNTKSMNDYRDYAKSLNW